MLGSIATNVSSFFEKAFTYGALTWLLVRAGCSMGTATLWGASLVPCLRLVQLYVPGRSAEITDWFMLMILAAMMKLMSEEPSGFGRSRQERIDEGTSAGDSSQGESDDPIAHRQR